MKSILYSGYANSGGTIIGLIFEEIEHAVVLPMEFRLLKERYGICELEDALFKTNDQDLIDLAIKDFEWLCQQYANPLGRFRKTGYAYEKRSGNIFKDATRTYIDSIIDFTYPKSWHFYDFKLNYIQLILQRSIKKIIKRTSYGNKQAYITYVDRDDFLKHTKYYLETIQRGFLHQQAKEQKRVVKDNSLIVLPKSIPLYSAIAMKQIVRYFNECKIILIDRDPRDIFIEVSKGKQRNIQQSYNPLKRAQSFIQYYESLRADTEEIKTDSNILFLKFEDLVLDYSNQLNKIYNFLDISPQDHTFKGSMFRPDESVQNIGLWKKSHDLEAEAIKLIESKLSNYLYNA